MTGFWYRVKRGARGLGLAAFLLVAGGSAAFLAARAPQSAGPRANQPGDNDNSEKLRRDERESVIVPPGMIRKMGLGVATIAERVRPVRLPPLQGVLAVDAEHLARVRARFAGEVVSIGPDAETSASVLSSFTLPRPCVGNTVQKGELLAVVVSKDLGEKKSELVDSLSKLRADEAVLGRLRDGQADGSIPARSVWDAERIVEADRVASARAERTLRAWRLTDAEIAEVRSEADRLSAAEIKSDTRPGDPNRWARVEIRAPANGVILEKNVAVGDIVETTADLFKIGDLSHLIVWAHLYEEDLPLVQALPRPIRWTVTLPARPRRPSRNARPDRRGHRSQSAHRARDRTGGKRRPTTPRWAVRDRHHRDFPAVRRGRTSGRCRARRREPERDIRPARPRHQSFRSDAS